MASKFRKGDMVKVITGKYKGKISEVLSLQGTNKILLKETNTAQKHIKPSKINPEGGVIPKEMPIHISNVMHIYSDKNSITKVGIKCLENGKRVRYAKKTGVILNEEKTL